MNRDLTQMTESEFDLVVIGAARKDWGGLNAGDDSMACIEAAYSSS